MYFRRIILPQAVLMWSLRKITPITTALFNCFQKCFGVITLHYILLVRCFYPKRLTYSILWTIPTGASWGEVSGQGHNDMLTAVGFEPVTPWTEHLRTTRYATRPPVIVSSNTLSSIFINNNHFSVYVVVLCILGIAQRVIVMPLMHNDTFKLRSRVAHYLPDWLLLNLNCRSDVCFGLISTIVSINPYDGSTQTQESRCDGGQVQMRSRLMDHRTVH